MARAHKKQFRIEQVLQPRQASLEEEDISAFRHQELLNAISRLTDDVEADDHISEELLEKHRKDLEEAQHLKQELAEIYNAIADTKREIATLHHNSFANNGSAAASYELDEVVRHTEQATDAILSSAETIDNNATDLIASLKIKGNNNLASDIQDQVMTIFEACNFQDVTGQRINKVVKTFQFIEDRINGIMEIWGGTEGFKDIAPDAVPEPQGDEALKHGPSMGDDPTTANQDDIDALFN